MSYLSSAPGSGGAVYNPVYAEVPSGTINGSNTVFTLAGTPSPSSSLQLYLNGQLQEEGVGNDYTLSGQTITFAAGPLTGSVLLAFYNEA